MVVSLIVPAGAMGQQTELRRPPVPELRRAPAEPDRPQREPQPPSLDGPRDTTPGTYRDPGAQAIGTIHNKTKEWAGTKVNKFKNWLKYDAPPGFNTGAHRQYYRQEKRVLKAAARLAKDGGFQVLGVVNFASDGGARVGGHLAEGDLGGAGVACLDEGAKALSAKGGAWAGGSLGTKVGLAIAGPPGSLVGGAVGAVAGAVVATVGYNAYVSPALTGMVEGATEPDYLEAARRNRAEHLAAIALREKEKELFVQQARQAREEHAAIEQQRVQERESYVEQARESRREFLEALRAAKAEATPKPAETSRPDPPSDEARPVIPADCTIIATIWNTEHPEHTAEIVYHIRNNEVTATSNMSRPTGDHIANWQSRFQFDGTLTDNRIRGTGRWNMSWDSVHQEWVIHYQTQSTSEDDIVFHVDGTLQATHSASNKTTYTYRRKPANSTAEDGSITSQHTANVAGRWKFGGGAKDKGY